MTPNATPNTELQWLTPGGQPLPTDQVYNVNLNKGWATYPQERVCSRCGGKGGSEAWAHTGFTCYKCGGTGGRHVVPARCYTRAALDAVIAAQAAKEQARIDAQIQRNQAALAARKTAFTEWLQTGEPDGAVLIWASEQLDSSSNFLADMAHRLRDFWIPSRAQYDALVNAKAREDERARIATESRHLGEVGTKLGPTKVFLVRVFDYSKPDDYPPIYRWKHVMRTEDDQTLIYTGGSKYVPHQEQDVPFLISGKIKKLDDYKGTKQTHIERPAVTLLESK